MMSRKTSKSRGAASSERGEPGTGEPFVEEAAAADTEVVSKPLRRRFTAEYKLRILDEVDQADPGLKGAILRREGLYSSHLTEWRKAGRRGSLKALSKKRGRKSRPVDPLSKKVARLERELAKTREELRRAHLILDVQGKVSRLLGIDLTSEKDS